MSSADGNTNNYINISKRIFEESSHQLRTPSFWPYKEIRQSFLGLLADGALSVDDRSFVVCTKNYSKIQQRNPPFKAFRQPTVLNIYGGQIKVQVTV